MPQVRNSRELKQAAENRTFLNKNAGAYEIIQQFTQKMLTLQDKLKDSPGSRQIHEQVSKFAGALMNLQMHDSPLADEKKLSTAISDVTLDMPYYLRRQQGNGKTGYEELLEEGLKYKLFTEQELDQALELIGQGMGVELHVGDPNAEKKRAAGAQQKAGGEPRVDGRDQEDIKLAHDTAFVLGGINKNLTEGYMPQREIPGEETLSEKTLAFVNKEEFRHLAGKLGIPLANQGDPVPETGGAPRIFVMDEKDPSNPRSLEEMNVKTGSFEFWELAQQGRMFAYPVGGKEPVQVQLRGYPPRMRISKPLSQANTAIDEDKPDRPKMPKPVPRPGVFARFMNWVNSSWYKKENDDYRAYRAQCEKIESDYTQAQEAYEQRRKAAGKIAAEKVPQLAAAAEKAFGGKRTEANVAREQIAYQKELEEKARASERKELDGRLKSAENDNARLERSVDEMSTLLGLEPRPIEKYLRTDVYKEEAFKIFKKVDLPEDATIGGVEVDDRLFANIALHAMLHKDIFGQSYKKVKGENAEQILMGEGMDRKEAERLMINSYAGLVFSDLLKNQFRSRSDSNYFAIAEAGRQKAAEAIRAYRQGNKEPLADIIFSAADYLASSAKNSSVTGHSTLADAKLTGELLDLLAVDEDLKAKTAERGLTEKTVNICRGADYLRELSDDNLEAEAKLMKARAEKKELPQEEKAEALHAIFKYRTASASVLGSVDRKLITGELKARIDEVEQRGMATMMNKDYGKPMPAGVKPLDYGISSDIMMYLPTKMLKSPPIYKELVNNHNKATIAEIQGEDPQPDSLDKIADMTVKGLKLDQMDTATLADKLVGGKGISGNDLLMEQEKMFGEIEKNQNMEMEKEKSIDELLNNGFVYQSKQGTQDVPPMV